ncbi:hypothetical protein RF11_13233 [Thelohanellus kitauei]|uniref:Uncharacterized protein n=1 Tax=Thelohanellus kitauei TaxID=669202 RepID=A0A0C2IYI6_THEKT|nr:hypothetical protein RF11_13233 [Thelohanellus kitauei]
MTIEKFGWECDETNEKHEDIFIKHALLIIPKELTKFLIAKLVNDTPKLEMIAKHLKFFDSFEKNVVESIEICIQRFMFNTLKIEYFDETHQKIFRIMKIFLHEKFMSKNISKQDMEIIIFKFMNDNIEYIFKKCSYYVARVIVQKLQMIPRYNDSLIVSELTEKLKILDSADVSRNDGHINNSCDEYSDHIVFTSLKPPYFNESSSIFFELTTVEKSSLIDSIRYFGQSLRKLPMSFSIIKVSQLMSAISKIEVQDNSVSIIDLIYLSIGVLVENMTNKINENLTLIILKFFRSLKHHFKVWNEIQRRITNKLFTEKPEKEYNLYILQILKKHSLIDFQLADQYIFNILNENHNSKEIKNIILTLKMVVKNDVYFPSFLTLFRSILLISEIENNISAIKESSLKISYFFERVSNSSYNKSFLAKICDKVFVLQYSLPNSST